jgi:hypothetical protein
MFSVPLCDVPLLFNTDGEALRLTCAVFLYQRKFGKSLFGLLSVSSPVVRPRLKAANLLFQRCDVVSFALGQPIESE